MLFERYALALDQILEIGRLHADEQAPSGSVRVTAMAGLFEFFRMEWLVESYARYPHISIDFLLDDTPSAGAECNDPRGESGLSGTARCTTHAA